MPGLRLSMVVVSAERSMMLHCALCGRATLHPAVMIGTLPVGPKCAKRAGLLPLAQKRVGLVKSLGRQGYARKADAQTLDLFAEAQA